MLESGQSQQHSKGSSSNSGASIGVGASVGAQTGVYAYAEFGVGNSKNKSDSNTHNQTVLQADHLILKSKGDTTLVGAQGIANRIDADVGGQLSIISPKYTANQSASDSGVGARLQISFGTAWQASGYNGSGNINLAKGKGKLDCVSEQSGLFAGEGGYHVNADSVNLVGGAIVSTADKEHNQLTTNAPTFSNAENKSSYSASNVSLNGKQTTVEELGIHSDASTTHS